MLIRQAELDFGARMADVRVTRGRVAEIASTLLPRAGEAVVEARGGLLLPSLHDAHIHLYAQAAAEASVQCGPPFCNDAGDLAEQLSARDAELPPGEWLRGVGYHDAMLAGAALDRSWLDRVVPERPVRIQHRSGRLWILNSAALRALGVQDGAGDDPCERQTGRLSGRLYDADAWLRARLPARRPDLSVLSRRLWSLGVTAVTDTGHDNDLDAYAALGSAQADGSLLQDVEVMGSAALDRAGPQAVAGRSLSRGARKFHLHDHALPDFDGLCAEIRAAHAVRRNVAFHCVSRVDLTFALAALTAAGCRPGDRIEHASVAPPELVTQIAVLGLTVVTQPGLVAERGDDYLREVDAEDQAWLYRLQAWDAAGVPWAASSDAPYSAPNPWASMAVSVTRRTRGGAVLGADEAITPQRAVSAWLGSPTAPAGPRRVCVGAAADLCLLPAPWAAVSVDLASVRPVAVWLRGVSLA